MNLVKIWFVVLSLVSICVIPSQAIAQTMSIMPVGDSITQGVRGECGYRRALSQTLLGNSQCDVSFVGSRSGSGDNSNTATTICDFQNTDHQSQPGIRADQILNIIGARVTTYQPDVVLLHVGSNDIFQDQTVASTVTEVDGIITSVIANQPNATVVIANIIPWSEETTDPISYPAFPNTSRDMIADTAQLSADLQTLVNTRMAAGDDVVLVDVKTGFDNSLMSIDGVHPNPVGEAHLSNKMMNVLYSLGACNGIQTDAQPPITYISTPSEQSELLPPSPTFTGTALDDGGSGFDRVRIAVEDSAGQWLNYASGDFGSGFDSSIIATMANTTAASTSWSIATELSAGDYTLYALALDNEGNQVYEAAGNGQPASNQKVWTSREFEVVDVELDSPNPGSTLSGSSETFSWTANGADITSWWLYLGSNPGGLQHYNSGNIGSATSTTAASLPTDGSTIYARLWYRQAGQTTWNSIDETYTAATSGATPAVTNPSVGSTLASTSETFSWNDNGTSVSTWWVYAGTSANPLQYFNSGSIPGGTTSTVVSGLPSDGSTVDITLWYRSGSNPWQSVVTSYTATTGSGPAISSPSDGSALGSSSQTFTWSANGTAVDQYWLYAGSTANGRNYYNADQGTGTSALVSGLPTNGSTVFVRLWHRVNGGVWQSVDTSYTAASNGPSITSPATGATLTSPSQTFAWTANSTTVNEWWVYAGSTSGGKQYFDSGSLGSATSQAITGLPTGSVPVFITLWHRETGGGWSKVTTSYMSAP